MADPRDVRMQQMMSVLAPLLFNQNPQSPQQPGMGSNLNYPGGSPGFYSPGGPGGTPPVMSEPFPYSTMPVPDPIMRGPGFGMTGPGAPPPSSPPSNSSNGSLAGTGYPVFGTYITPYEEHRMKLELAKAANPAPQLMPMPMPMPNYSSPQQQNEWNGWQQIAQQEKQMAKDPFRRIW